MSNERLLILKGKKRRIKRQMRKKRKELLMLERELMDLNRDYKTEKEIQMNRKHQASLMDRAKRGDKRLKKIDIIKLMEEGA